MKWHIEVHGDDGIVALKVSGPATVELIAEMSAEAIGVARRHGTSKFLADVREMTFSVSEILLYDLPDMLEERGLLRTEQVAIVYPANSMQGETFLFLENIFVNRSFRFSLFTDPDDAQAWLKASF